jgi:hypothetical protein
MREVSLIIENEIVASLPTKMTDEECQDLDKMLREKGILTEDQELAITE